MDNFLLVHAVGAIEWFVPAMVPYVTATVTIAAAIATQLPAPPQGDSFFVRAWGVTYRVVNWVAINFKHATNANDPSVRPALPSNLTTGA